MTLSRFLRDYIYIPLGGNRKGNLRTYINLMATFVLGGIWHGAGWTYVFWGFLHGIALVINHAWKSLGLKLPTILAWFITFNFVNIAWVFFRAPKWDDAINVLSAMIDFGDFDFGDFGNDIYWKILVGILAVLFLKNSNEWLINQKADKKFLALVTGMLVVAILSLSKVSEFIYFQF